MLTKSRHAWQTDPEMKADEGYKYMQKFRSQAWPWMNQCVCCQNIGHKPEIPESIHPGFLAQNLRRYFRPLALNDQGLCEQCAQS